MDILNIDQYLELSENGRIRVFCFMDAKTNVTKILLNCRHVRMIIILLAYFLRIVQNCSKLNCTCRVVRNLCHEVVLI